MARGNRLPDHTLTADDVAAALYVHPATVRKWVDTGLLPGHKLPGSNYRRVLLRDLILFVRRHHLMCDLDLGWTLLATLPDVTPRDLPYSVVVPTVLEAGVVLGGPQPPRTLVLDAAALGRGEALSAARAVRVVLPTTRVVLVACEDEGDPAALAAADRVVRRPAGADAVRDAVLEVQP